MEKTKPRASNRSRKQTTIFTIAEEPKKERKKRRISDNEKNEKSKEQKLSSPPMEEISFRIGVVNSEAVNHLANGSKCHACGHLVPSSEWRPESRICHSCAKKPLPSSSSSSSLSTIDRHLLSPIDRSKKPRSSPSPSRSPRPIEDNEVTVQDKGDIALEKINKIPSHRWYPFEIPSSASQSASCQLMNWSSSSDEMIDQQSFITDRTQSFGEIVGEDNRALTEMSDELPSVPVPGEAMIAVPSARPLLDSVQRLLGQMMFVEEGISTEEKPYDSAIDNEKSSSQVITSLDTLTSLLSFGPSILHPFIVIALINRLIAPRTPTFCATAIFEFIKRHANGCRRTATMTMSNEKILRLASIWHPSVCQLQTMTALCRRVIGIINRKKRGIKEADLLLLYKSKLVIELFLDSLRNDFLISPSTNTYIHRANQSPLFSSPLNQCFQSLRQCIDVIKTKLSKASPISDEELPIIYSMHHQITQFFQQIDHAR